MSHKKNAKIDMCNGPLLPRILLFSVPLMISGILQLLFNAADTVIVGIYSGNQALAAVGSTGSVSNLLVNVFIGLSVGVNVMVARYNGARKDKDIKDTVHTAVLTAILGGAMLTLLGVLAARPLLQLMDTPADVIDLSVLYMRIYFLGTTGMLIYNFGSAVLRGLGDTKRPMYILIAAGSVNVVFNLIFVIGFRMGVAGVALATVISQYLSAGLVVFCLLRLDACHRLEPRSLRIVPEKLSEMAKTGVPAGLQGTVFSISNVLIQSSLNSFGSIAMAGNTAASNIEGFVYTAMNSFYQAALSFTSANLGARQYKRITKVMLCCLALTGCTGLVLGNVVYLFGEQLLGIYSSDAEVVAYGLQRMSVICTTYFLCGLMDVMSGVMRGLGYSIIAMIVSLMGACGLRVLWILTVFQTYRSLNTLFISYPFTWAVTFSAHLICFLIVRKKVMPDMQNVQK